VEVVGVEVFFQVAIVLASLPALVLCLGACGSATAVPALQLLPCLPAACCCAHGKDTGAFILLLLNILEQDACALPLPSYYWVLMYFSLILSFLPSLPNLLGGSSSVA
jgi:hypothetical protein